MIKDIVCPFCLRHFRENKLIRACSKNNAHVQKSFPLFGADDCKETGCWGRYIDRLCPLCGEKLPSNIAQYQDYTRLSITAPSRGGKTVLITTMIHEVFANASLLGLNMGSMDTKTSEYYRKNAEALYGSNPKAPDPNQKGDVVPMQWYVQNVRKGNARSVPTYSLTIFDGAGESQSDPSDLETRYIAESKMLMLLLDPLQLKGIRDQLTDQEIMQAGGNPSVQISDQDTRLFIDGIVNYIRTCNKITVSQKLKLPVAVVMCKMDIMQRFFPAESVVFQSSGHVAAGKFQEQESQNVHAEIDNWIASTCEPLNIALSAVFQKWRYFGVSSYGIIPRDASHLNAAPRPLRVLDPLMWNLSMTNII